MTWSPSPADMHHPVHATVTDCDYKDYNLVCAADGDDWPCTTKQALRKEQTP